MQKPPLQLSHPGLDDPDGSKELDEQLVSLCKTLTAAAGLYDPPPEATEPAQNQLPMWPVGVRGGPNAILRSALFAGIHSKKRATIGEYVKPEKPLQAVTLAAQEGVVVKFAGRQLNQYDADVFFETLHRARLHPLETECLFTGYSLLKGIGRPTSEQAYEDLDDSLTRLRDGRVEIHWESQGIPLKFVGGLISEYSRGEGPTDKLFKVKLASAVKTLFRSSCWTQIEWEERQALRGHPLASWLHSYYSTHANPLPVKCAFLHEKTGSKRPTVRNFRTDLKAALKTLHDVLGWDWELDPKTDLVTVRRQPSRAQARHLDRKRQRRRPLTAGKGRARARDGAGATQLRLGEDLAPA